MANFTVSDILAKGFKYIQTAEEQVVPAATGTRGAFIGSAHWGKINTPTLIDSGANNFTSIFGAAGTEADEGWEAAYYHFRNSQLGYFTRIASSQDVPRRSYVKVKDIAAPAILTGTVDLSLGANLRPSAAASPQNVLAFDVTFKGSGMSAAETESISVNFESESAKSYGALIDSAAVSSGTFETGSSIEFKVYNEAGTLDATLTKTFASDVAFVDAATWIDAVTGSTGGTGIDFTNHATVSVSSTSVRITTEPYFYGRLSKIVVSNDDSNIFTDGKVDNGANVSADVIADTINSVFQGTTAGSTTKTFAELFGSTIEIASIVTSSDGEEFLVITAPNSGATSTLLITTGNARVALLNLAENTTSSGKAEKTIGTFRAIYRGKEGDTIQIVVSGTTTAPTMEIYFRGTLVQTIVNYNYDSTSQDYIQTIINENDILSQIVRYDHGRDFEVFDEDDDSLDTGTALSIESTDKIGIATWTLTNGDSGITNINIVKDVIPQISKYSNIDYYDIDYIATPGYPEQKVQEAVDAACISRQDSFALIDLPELSGLNAVSNAIKWTNGQYTGRTEKINSIYGAIYFPFIKVRKRLYDSSMNKIQTLGDYTPTIRIPGVISRSDFLARTTYSNFAGEIRGTIPDVEGVQVSLSQADKDKLYADVYDGVINPISFNIQSGFFVDGQKTTLRKNENGKLTALSRINVMRTGLFIKKEIQRIIKFFYYEPTDPTSWAAFSSIITGIMNSLVERRAIEGNFVVVSDASTNTAEVTNNNGMVATIEWTPLKSTERIKVYSNIKERVATITIA